MTDKEKQMIHDLVRVIAGLKEENCGNAGWNWLERFEEQYKDILTT